LNHKWYLSGLFETKWLFKELSLHAWNSMGAIRTS
jgi:hypothetical protein